MKKIILILLILLYSISSFSIPITKFFVVVNYRYDTIEFKHEDYSIFYIKKESNKWCVYDKNEERLIQKFDLLEDAFEFITIDCSELGYIYETNFISIL